MNDSTKPISSAEMVEMFGEKMPIEAVKLVFDANGETTLGELRAKLRKIAANRPPMTAPTDALIERLTRGDDLLVALHTKSAELSRSLFGDQRSVGKLLGEAADRIESLLARIEAAEKALDPNETKADYIGEFHFDINDWDDDGEERPRRMVAVPWTTIKEIMAAIRARAAAQWQAGQEGEG